MAATELRSRWRRAVGRLLPGLAGPLAVAPALAVDLPQDRAEAIVHVYDGGGVRATGPALFVRKKLADRVSLSGQYYVDSVSNASIDVVSTASPYKEKRTAVDVGAEFVAGNALVKLGAATSDEPDYKVKAFSLDVAQETFGGMTTVSLGFGRSADEVGRSDIGFFDRAKHWQYRAGVTQILSPRWLASLNFEAVSDSGFLGSPYRVARVRGAPIDERNPRTRSSRALRLSSAYDVGDGLAVNGGYRYFWDNWDIRAHTIDAGVSRRVGERWLVDASARLYSQSNALFYSDNAADPAQYVSRNRQLSTFTTRSLGLKAAYTARSVPGRYELKLHAAYEFVRFAYKDFYVYPDNDFGDLDGRRPYAFNAHVVQLFASASF